MNIYAIKEHPFDIARELDDRTLRLQLKYMRAMVAYIETGKTHRYVTSKFKEWACHGETSKRNEHRWCTLFYCSLLSEHIYRFSDKVDWLTPSTNGKVQKSVIVEGVGRILLYHDPKDSLVDHSNHYPTYEAYQYLLRSRYMHKEPKWTKRNKPAWVNYDDRAKLACRFIQRYHQSGNTSCTKCGNNIIVKGDFLSGYYFRCKTTSCLTQERTDKNNPTITTRKQTTKTRTRKRK